MAYQSVGQCRFFVDHLLWLKTLGLEYYGGYSGIYIDTTRESFIGLNPTQSNIVNVAGASPPNIYIDYVAAPPIKTSDNKWKAYIAILGHNSASAQAAIRFVADGVTHIYPDYRINFSPDTSSSYDGFTLGYIFDNTATTIRFGHMPVNVTDGYLTDFHIGCISHGNYFDMPHSPDLNLTMTREYGGIKTIETKGGASLSNAFYTKPPKWGNLGAWELGNGDPKLSTSGRRVWDLSFSYIQDSDIFPEVSNLNALESLSPEGLSYETDLDPTGNTLLDDPNFYSQVIHKTNGQLPFIFQPDNSNNNADGFAIAKLDMKEFKFEQVANGVYNVKLKIREVW